MAPPRADAQSGKPDKTGRAQANPDVTVEAPPDISGDEEDVSDFDEDAALAFEEPSSGGGLLASSGLTVRNLEAFSRKVTTTANHLMSARNNSPALPLSEGYASPSTSRRRDTSKNRSTSQSRSRRTQSGALTRSNNKTNHSDPYQDALRHIHSEIRKSPALQRRVFSFARTTPTELVRSKLSTSEIQSRALCSVPDELLVNIPEDTSTYSLFQGFQASVETAGGKEGGTGTDGAESEIRRARRRRLEWGKLLESGDAEGEDGKDAKAKGKKTREALAELSKDRDKLAHRLDIMGVRKNMCSSEIKELDQKIMNLHRMRDIVLERLAGLEMDEQDLEYELTQLDNKLEDLEDEVELIDEAAKDEADANAPADSSQADQQDGFMSQSVYEKLPSAAEESGNNKTPSRSRASRKKPPKRAPPILHGHLDPGSSIRNLQTHTDTITALDFDAPFGTMVTAALDDTVRVWDLNLGSCMGHLEGHCASVRCLQVEDNIVATGSMDATVRLWDLSRVEYVPGREERKEGYVSSQGEADEEQAVVSTSGEQEGTVEPPTPSLPPAPSGSTHNCPLFTLEAHVDEVTALHFRGDTLISGSADKTLRQWDLQSGRCVQTLDVLWAAAQASTITSSSASTLSLSSAFGHYGYHAANAASSADANADFVGAVQVFESALAAGTADGMVRLWDLRSGQVSRSLVGHTGAVTCLQFDDTHLVTGSLDRSVRIWDLRTGSIFDAYAYERPITSMMFDPRRIVAAAGEDVVKVYDKTDGRHWDCGDASSPTDYEANIVERVRIKDGYLVGGRRNGVVGVWTC